MEGAMGKLAESPEPVSGRKYTCRLSDILSLIDEEDRAVVHARIADTSISDRGISQWLTSNGPLPISTTVIEKHRHGRTCRTCNG